MSNEKDLNEDGGMAYPFSFLNNNFESVTIDGFELPAGHAIVNTGMTLRDYFAAKAMQGAAASDVFYSSCEAAAEDAYKMADAMLSERNK